MSKVNISLPDEVLKEIDWTRKKKRLSRSELIRQAFQAYRQILEEEEREEEKRRGIARAIKLQEEVGRKIGTWDTIAVLREWREKRR